MFHEILERSEISNTLRTTRQSSPYIYNFFVIIFYLCVLYVFLLVSIYTMCRQVLEEARGQLQVSFLR